MNSTFLTIRFRGDEDVLTIRQRARRLAARFGFGRQEQTRIATAVSEIAWSACELATGGTVEFRYIQTEPPMLQITIILPANEILDLGLLPEGQIALNAEREGGFPGIGRWMDRFETITEPEQGIRVVMGKYLPPLSPLITSEHLAAIGQELAQDLPVSLTLEAHLQNQELIHTLDLLQARQEEITLLNRELADTNRGVVALYAELEDKALALEHANKVKTRFFSDMSHEFRTPVNAIRSLARMLYNREDGDLTPEQERQVGFIQRSADELSDLVNDLLDLAKVEAGKMIVRKNTFDIAELFPALLGPLRALTHRNDRVALVFEDASDLPPLTTDEGKVSQILRNFISNALKYTEQGEVRVSASQNAEGQIVFAVADTGIGIAPEDQERIFQEFVQVDNRLQRRLKGTGLGLSLTRKLAELLGGSVSLESTPGVGSTFRLTLPPVYAGFAEVSSCEVEAREEVSEEDSFVVEPIAPTFSEAAVNGALVIDDAEALRYRLCTALNRLGYRVLEARDGLEGMRLARAAPPRIIFLDLTMPGMNGFVTLEHLKSDPYLANVPVVIYTSRDLTPEEQEQLMSKAVALLLKDDFSRKDEVECLRAILQQVGIELPGS